MISSSAARFSGSALAGPQSVVLVRVPVDVGSANEGETHTTFLIMLTF